MLCLNLRKNMPCENHEMHFKELSVAQFNWLDMHIKKLNVKNDVRFFIYKIKCVFHPKHRKHNYVFSPTPHIYSGILLVQRHKIVMVSKSNVPVVWFL